MPNLAGADRYDSWIVSHGMGHLGGGGLLRDAGDGGDLCTGGYIVQGVGRLGDVGALLDRGGADSYRAGPSGRAAQVFGLASGGGPPRADPLRLCGSRRR